MSTERKSLPRLFDELNRQFFEGKLRKCRVRRYTPPNNPHQRGLYDPSTRTISVRSWLTGQELRITLLHEMCHIGTPHHGLHFLTKLRKLASMGESWAQEEAEAYAVPTLGPRHPSEVKELIVNIAISNNYTVSWVSVRRYIANELDLKPTEITEKYPWAKRAWERECETHRLHQGGVGGR